MGDRLAEHKKCKEPECEECRRRRQFKMPQEIVNALENGKLVIFAGSGISTESSSLHQLSLYNEVKRALRIPANKKISFSKLMSEFCKREDGRRKLLIRIRERFKNLESCPEAYNLAVRFHRELSTLYNIKEIVTTNWDDLFERECAAVPFVSPEDFVFWDNDARRVLKLHGSVTNYGSIVATEEDYQKCYEKLQTNQIGAYLKMLLATKKILFVGYSFGDEDFNRIYSLLKSDMKGLAPKAYLVTTDEASKKRFEAMKLTTIITDASYFIEELKKIEVAKGNLIPDERFDAISEAYERVYSTLKELTRFTDNKKTPSLVFTQFYWDGLLHSFGTILTEKDSGRFSHKCNVCNRLDNVYKFRKERAKKKDYSELAYLDGFAEGLLFFLENSPNPDKLRVYYLFGCKKKIRTSQEYLKFSKKAGVMHKAAHTQAIKLVNSAKGLYWHHSPAISPQSTVPEFQC